MIYKIAKEHMKNKQFKDNADNQPEELEKEGNSNPFLKSKRTKSQKMRMSFGRGMGGHRGYRASVGMRHI